jgi:polyhydroxybutyrate depolymerase
MVRMGGGVLAGLAVLAVVVSCGCRGRRYIDVAGQRRAWVLHVPENLPAEEPVPLLLALHQFSDTPEGMRDLTGFNAIADREGFIVVYPKGRWRIWNPADNPEEPGDAAFLLALMDKLCAAYNIDCDRIYATGASAGAMMIQGLACRTDRLAAIAPVMGTTQPGVLEASPAVRRIPVLMMHGTADPVLPFGTAGERQDAGRHSGFLSAPDNAAWWAQRNGCGEESRREMLPDRVPGDDSTVEKVTWECPETAPVVFYRINGGGHTWPGHDNWYPAFIVGETSMEIDASEIIWDFLEGHRRQAG